MISTPVGNSRRMMFWIALVTLVIGIILIAIARPKPATGNPDAQSSPSLDATSTVELIPAHAPIDGPFAAKVTIVEFLDYQCPGCGEYQPVLNQMREDFRGKIKFVARQFPIIEIHPFAFGAAISAVCAQRQGKFFEYSDVLFMNQNYLRRLDLERYAEELGLGMDDFKTCLDDPKAQEQVIRDRKDGEALHIPGTPSVFVNGTLLKELLPPDELKELINKELAK